MKDKQKLIPYLLKILCFTISAHANANVLLELDGQTHQGNITDQTAASSMDIILDNQSALEGDLNLLGEESNYDIILNNDSRWDGKLNATSTFSLILQDSTKTGGIFYDRGSQLNGLSNVSIHVGSNSTLDGPVRILGNIDSSLDMSTPVSFSLGENSVVNTGSDGVYIDNNGQGISLSAFALEDAPSSWTGDITIKENTDPNGTNYASEIYFAYFSFSGNVTVPVLSSVGLHETKWVGDITVLPQTNNSMAVREINFSLSNVDFQGNVDYQGANFTFDLYAGKWNGQIKAKNIDGLGYFTLIGTNSLFAGDIAITNMEYVHMNVNDHTIFNGNIVLNSDLQMEDRLDFYLHDGSSWTGNLDLSNATMSEDASRYMYIHDAKWTGHIIGGAGQNLVVDIFASNKGDAVWHMTGSSNIQSLQTDPNVAINFVNQDKNNTKPQFHTLTVSRMLGGAEINMRVGTTGSDHDQIVIKESVQDNYLINVQDNPEVKVIGWQIYEMVDYNDIGLLPTEASFTFTNADHKIELGGYVYDMILGKEGTFSIEGKALPDGNGNGSGNNGGKPSLSNTASAAANSLITSYMFNEVQMHNLQQRMGDLRNTEHLNNVWIRSYNGQFDSKANGMLQGFDMDYNGMHIGADTSINLADNQRVYLGVMAGTTKADVDYNKGSTGKVKDHQLGVYGTYVTDNQFYVDAIAKYSRVKQEIDARMQSSGRQRASASKDVYSFSVEAGKRFNITDSSGGFYIEPQAQLLVTNNESTQFRTDKGLTVDIDGYTSVQARGGVQVGYQFNETKVPVNIYARSQLIHEFKDRVAYYVNDSKEEHSFKGSRWQNSLGTSININKQHSIHADIDYENSNKYKHTQWNIGYRYSF
ncbi:autotransporter outer membrane beta-barrel domain-containing protein [Neisseria sp. Ec49-e6-T10]|uniref:autotransporter outer membrane beta-barrel domain-containing protein n=1 Tax=Neisseria sp. Ec49-e6-T10 TaxID=3140744 RepID=UPI003EB99ACD